MLNRLDTSLQRCDAFKARIESQGFQISHPRFSQPCILRDDSFCASVIIFDEQPRADQAGEASAADDDDDEPVGTGVSPEFTYIALLSFKRLVSSILLLPKSDER